MRDIIVSLVILGLMPTCFRRPFVGLLVFSWLAYMRIQDLTWYWARDVRWSYYVAIIMFLGFVVNRRPGQRWFLPDLRCWVMIGLVVLVGMGVLAADRGGERLMYRRYLEFVKIVTIALFTTAVVVNREQLRVLVWVIALSFAFYGVKSGIWGILTLGRSQILKGPGGLLEDSNDFSLAMAMAVPMIFQLAWTERQKLIRRAFWIALPLTIITVMLTHSRGGFLSVAVAVCVLVWRSRNRVAGFTIVALCSLVTYFAAPSSYIQRLETIKDPTSEGSARSRLRAWGIASRMAMDNPVLGVGLTRFPRHFVDYAYDPTPKELSGKEIIVAHSSYMQIWAECGTPAFMLYLSMIGFSFWTCWKIRRRAEARYKSSWIINYAVLFEGSVAAFVVGSAFLNRAHFDLFYHWVAIIAVFQVLATKEMEERDVTPVREGGRGAIRSVHRPGFGPRPRVRGFLPRVEGA